MSTSKKINLREGEEVLEILRRYPLTYAHIYFLGLLLLGVAAFFTTWLFAQGWWGQTVYGLSIFCGLYLIFRTWYFSRANALVITSLRVVDIARLGWLEEVVSSVSYGDITDVSYRKSGLLANMFGYGNVYLQTKSQQFILEISQVRQPQKVVSFILEQIEFYRRGKGELSVEEIYKKFIKIIPELTDEELSYIDDIIHDEIEGEIVAIES